MRSEDFVALRRDDWNRLENLLARAGGGHLNGLAPAQVLIMAALYRRATADLARAQRDWPGEPVHRYLNGLVARGHGVVYRRGGEVWRRIRAFYYGGITLIDEMSVTRWEPPRFLQVAHHRKPVLGDAWFEIIPLEDGSAVEWVEDLELPLGRLGELAGSVARAPVEWGLRKSLTKLKGLVEASS